MDEASLSAYVQLLEQKKDQAVSSLTMENIASKVASFYDSLLLQVRSLSGDSGLTIPDPCSFIQAEITKAQESYQAPLLNALRDAFSLKNVFPFIEDTLAVLISTANLPENQSIQESTTDLLASVVGELFDNIDNSQGAKETTNLTNETNYVTDYTGIVSCELNAPDEEVSPEASGSTSRKERRKKVQVVESVDSDDDQTSKHPKTRSSSKSASTPPKKRPRVEEDTSVSNSESTTATNSTNTALTTPPPPSATVYYHPCPICHKVFPSRSSLAIHKLVHTGERPHVCQECGRTFTQKCSLKIHLTNHRGEKTHRCTWPDCDFMSTNSSDVNKHVRGMHFGLPQKKNKQARMGIIDDRDSRIYVQKIKRDSPVQGPSTGAGGSSSAAKVTTPRGNTQRNRRTKGSRVVPIRGATKGRPAKRAAAAVAAVVSEETEEQTTEDEMLDTPFEDEMPFEDEVPETPGEVLAPFSKITWKRVTRNSSASPVKSASKKVPVRKTKVPAMINYKPKTSAKGPPAPKGDPIPCPVEGCGKTFPNKKNLKLHSAMHVLNRPYPCEQCEASFPDRTRLNRHILTLHSTERPHVCEQCGKSFARKDRLVSHLKTHGGERGHSHGCTWPDCNFTTTSSSHVTEHVRQVHFKLPKSKSEQARRGIEDERDAREYCRRL